MYPQNYIDIKVEVKPCKITKFTPGALHKQGLQMAVLEDEKFLSGSPKEEFIQFDEYTYEPADCMVDNSPLKVIYTPLMRAPIVVPATNVSEIIKRSKDDDDTSQAKYQTYETVVDFIEFKKELNTNIFKVVPVNKYDAGKYTISIRAEIYNPYNDSIITNEDLSWDLEVTSVPVKYIDFNVQDKIDAMFGNNDPKFVQSPPDTIKVVIMVDVKSDNSFSSSNAVNKASDSQLMKYPMPDTQGRSNETIKANPKLSLLPTNYATYSDSQKEFTFLKFYTLNDNDLPPGKNATDLDEWDYLSILDIMPSYVV